MTISSIYVPPQYTGNGATKIFAFPFPFFDPTDIVVNLFDTAANADVSPQPVLNGAATYDYTVTGTKDPDLGEYVGGASVTFNNAPLSNHRITILRAVPALQPNVFINNAPFPAKVVESSLDRETMILQQGNYGISSLSSRALVIPVGDGPLNMTIPAKGIRANKFLGFDANGLPIVSGISVGDPNAGWVFDPLAGTVITNSKVGIGTIPIVNLDVFQQVDGGTLIRVTNNSGGPLGLAGLYASNGGHNTSVTHQGTGFTLAGVFAADRGVVFSNGAGGLAVATGGLTPLIFGINNNEVSRFDSVGRLGIGTPNPQVNLDVFQQVAGATVIRALNNSGATNAQAALQAGNGTNVSILGHLGTGFTVSGLSVGDRGVLYSNGTGGLAVFTFIAAPLILGVNNTEVARYQASAGVSALSLYHRDAGNPIGAFFNYPVSAPNDSGHDFLLCQDSGANRVYLHSNGGIGNFSANNQNLSDMTVKSDFQTYTPAELDGFETSFIAVDWGKFKYADQTHDDWNYGYSAQGVGAAFASAVPTLVDYWNPTKRIEVDGEAQTIATPPEERLLSVYTEDLNNIAHALLARALMRIAALEGVVQP